jgi:hypothetical protein
MRGDIFDAHFAERAFHMRRRALLPSLFSKCRTTTACAWEIDRCLAYG